MALSEGLIIKVSTALRSYADWDGAQGAGKTVENVSVGKGFRMSNVDMLASNLPESDNIK
ncbi:MAG: hypothetical protein JXA01_04775 [Dehalococcoidia bacterium]|nr:hypothetical protein [Dehalococcoidia bacterium]